MENYATAREQEHTNAEILGQKGQEKALREFKEVLNDLMFMLRSASGMETAYMYWVNRSREQFVMETQTTMLDNVMFKDRISFDSHFLDQYKDLDEPVSMKVGEGLPASALNHYYNKVPVQYVTLLPFVNNGETVAITVLESSEHVFTEDNGDVIYSYINALRNVLNTYLEISDLYEQQDEWVAYEETVSELEQSCHRAEMIKQLLNKIQSFLNDGGASFVTQGMGGWSNVMNSDDARYAPPIGMQMTERSMAYEAANQGEAEFAIHLNNNPNRLSPREIHTDGATMAIPLMMKDRRQGIVLVYDNNPLIFKESTKHKFINLVRTAALQIMANDPGIELDNPVFANEYRAFLPDVWERTVDAELHRTKKGISSYDSWFGLVTISNVAELRTKMRLEELAGMQQDLIKAFNPGQFGYPGILGYNSDYVYSFFLQNKDSETVQKWTRALKKKFSDAFMLSSGQEIQTNIKVGFVRLTDEYEDSYQLLTNAKSALSQALKSNKNEAI